MSVVGTETGYIRQPGAEGVNDQHLRKGFCGPNLKEVGVYFSEERGREQDSIPAGLVEETDAQQWKRERHGRRELHAGGCSWSMKWNAQEAGDVAGGPGVARASHVYVSLPTCCFNTSTSPFHFCVSFYKSSFLCFHCSKCHILHSYLALDNLLIHTPGLSFLINKMRMVSVLTSSSWGLTERMYVLIQCLAQSGCSVNVSCLLHHP